MNKAIVNGLKKRLKSAMGQGVTQHVVGLSNHPKWSISETPFSMTFETEAVTLMVVVLSSIRTTSFSLNTNDAARHMSEQLNFLEVNKEIASIQLVDYQ